MRAALGALAPATATAQPLRTPNNPHGDEKYTQVATDVRGQGPPLEGPAVAISAEERAANTIAPAKVAEIAANFLRDGFAIVHGLRVASPGSRERCGEPGPPRGSRSKRTRPKGMSGIV